jgi:ribonuclease E
VVEHTAAEAVVEHKALEEEHEPKPLV